MGRVFDCSRIARHLSAGDEEGADPGEHQRYFEEVPFTLSHAAAVIPFRRTPLLMSALVVGCFAPDFSHFLPQLPGGAYSHSFAGMFQLDFPLALAALWLFHAFVKAPMLMFLPHGFRRRLRAGGTDFSFWPWQRLLRVSVSILVGIATHLVWDAFTHSTSWVYQNWTFLRVSVELPTGEMWLDKLLEYWSSAVGLVVIAVWIWYWYRTTEPEADPVSQFLNGVQRQIFVVTLPALAILTGAIDAYRMYGFHREIRALVHFTTEMLVSGITVFLLGLLVCGIIGRVLHRWHVFCWGP